MKETTILNTASNKNDTAETPDTKRAMTPDKKRFLVVDDDPFVNETIVQLLQSMKFEIVARAYNGEQAIELFVRYRERINIVLMDVKSKKEILRDRLNGVSAAGYIRRICPSVKIVLMSSDPNNALFASELDNVDFIGKPFTGESLLSRLAD